MSAPLICEGSCFEDCLDFLPSGLRRFDVMRARFRFAK